MTEAKLELWARSFVPAWAAFVYALAVTLYVDAWMDRFAVGTALVLGGVLVLLAWCRRRAEVGAEAILIHWVFYQRTLRFSDVRRAVPGRKGVVLTTMRGETIELSAASREGALPDDVLERLWKAIAAGAEEGSRGTERETLARSGRTTFEWRLALRELGRPGSYRRSTLSPDRLWAIAENPGIESEVRAGALVALSTPSADRPARERFRRIAEATADPGLNGLLEEVANGGEIDERALEGVSPNIAYAGSRNGSPPARARIGGD